MSAKPQFLSVEHLPRLSKVLGSGGHVSKTAPAGLEDGLLEVADRFGNPRFLARNYIQSHCQESVPGQDEQDESRRSLFVTVDEFLTAGDGARGQAMFLLGDAGLGKTSLLVMLKLLHLAALWPKHHRCELLKLGSGTAARIGEIKTPRKTVLLLDGLNEDPAAVKDPAGRVAQILRATTGFYRVIITCRTPYRADGREDPFGEIGRLAGAGYGCPAFYLSPFNNPQADKYLKRRFQRMEEPNRKRAKAVLNGMGSLKFRPLVVSAADDFLHSRTKEWNASSVYETLFDAWLEREQRKWARTKADAESAAFDPDVLRDAMTKVARLMAMGETPGRLSAADLAGASLPAAELAQLARLDGRGGSLLWRDSGGGHHLSHPSIGEFLIALGLARGVLHSGKKRIPATGLLLTFLLEGRGSAIEWKALDLSRASFTGVHLQDAEFSGASLASANLSESAFTRSRFDNADLKLLEARAAKFFETSFKAANAAHARADSATFARCQFSQASFTDTVLLDAHFEGCTFENTSFADAKLSGAVFTRCKITRCNFTGADLSAASFRECSLTGVRFDNCSLTGANLAETTHGELSLSAADFRGAELDDAFLKAVRNPRETAWDPEIAKRLRFSSSENAQNAAAIDADVMR